MAEFYEVMRQFDRMCKAHAGCVDCPLAIKGCVETKCSIGSFIDNSENIEREIMQWAAANPEPVYPTWAEWILKVGAARRVPIGEPWPVEFPDGSMLEPCCETVVKENERIPADIAQKLGIEPKEGI